MTIAPIVKSVVVKAKPARAFDLFTASMGAWWPTGKTLGSKPHKDVIVEPRPGGRWFERSEDGEEVQWGKVLAWDPPRRVLLAWKLTAQWKYDPDFETEVEIRFDAEGGGTRVTLEHRDLQRFGADAAKHAESLNQGWPSLVEAYAEFVSNQGE